MFIFKKYTAQLLVFLLGLQYVYFGYFVDRTSFLSMCISWTGLFITSYLLYRHKSDNFYFWATAAIVLRILFLAAIPNLSQDFYRFIWDGRMLFEGLNPYVYLPETFIQNHQFPVAQAKVLYEGMGTLNGSHYTNYPPLNQFCFWIAAVLSEHSIIGAAVVLRLLIIIAEIGILVIGRKLLLQLKLPVANLFYYALNPFVIIELTGNLHFEPVLLFLLLYSLYLLQKNKWIAAAIFLAFSVSVKLIPLLFLPLFVRYFTEDTVNKNKALSKVLWFYLLVLGTVLLTFAPFLSKALLANYSASVGLWFSNFEFNASFYYIFREIGYTFRGYNEIATIGKILPILTILFLSYLSFKSNRNSMRVLLQHMLFALTFYYFFSTTVHPWYLATLVLLSIFTTYKYPIVWSFVIILSYQAYANMPWQENLWFVGAEYSIVFVFMYWEFKGRKNTFLKSKG